MLKRNDQILKVLPIGALISPGTGIQESFTDKAHKLGIRARDLRKEYSAWALHLLGKRTSGWR